MTEYTKFHYDKSFCYNLVKCDFDGKMYHCKELLSRCSECELKYNKIIRKSNGTSA